MTRRFLIASCSLLLAVVFILALPVMVREPALEARPTNPTTTAPTMPSSTPGVTTTAPEEPSGTAPSVVIPTTSTVEPSTTVPTAPSVTVPTEPTVPTVSTTQPTTNTTLPPRAGQVRLYTCDVARVESYMRLAVEYYQMMGVEVILQMPEEGETCEEGLARLMASDYKPTIFCLHQQQTLQKYADSLYDLTDSQAAAQLYSADFGMYLGEKLLALPVEVDWFGLIYNAKKLADAGFSRLDFYRPDIDRYRYILDIAQHLKSEGIDSFCEPDFANAAILSAVFADGAQLRSFIDLYVGNSCSGSNAMAAFQSGKNIFYASTSANFEAALSIGAENVDLLPAFVDGCNTMRYTCDNFLAIYRADYDPDVQATLAFLSWMVSGRPEGGIPMDMLGGRSPYKAAAVEGNALEKLLRKYMAQEPAQLVWDATAVGVSEMEAFQEALKAYYAKPDDDTWQNVESFIKKKEESADA